LNTWMFCIELLQKGVRYEIPLSNLYHRVAAYFAMLTQSEVDQHPLIPLTIVAHSLGLSDLEVLHQLEDEAIKRNLTKLGVYQPLEGELRQRLPTRAVFNIELERFQRTFGVSKMESLFLFD